MNNSFWQYIDRLELLAFFSGYPLVYAAVMVFSGNKKTGKKNLAGILCSLLPYAYALSGTLYVGLLMRNLYPDYSIKNIEAYFDNAYLKTWAILSLLFWIPLFAKKPVISLLHSLIFFFFFVKDIFLFNFSEPNHAMIKNEIKIYSDSLLLNVITFTAIALLYFLIMSIRNKKPIPRS